MLRVLPLLIVAACATEFVWEVRVGPVAEHMTVLVDGEPQQVVQGESYAIVVRRFSDYKEAYDRGAMEVQVLQGDKQAPVAIVKPGACHSDGTDWEYEALYIGLTIVEGELRITPSGYECRGPSGKIIGVVD